MLRTERGELYPDKTRTIEFGRFAWQDRAARGEGRPETFDFLGFKHYCRKTRSGKFGLGRKPIAKRVNRTLNRIKVELQRRMHQDVYVVGRWLGQMIRGWLGYYAVPTSFASLNAFAHRIKAVWLKNLRKRSQRDRVSCTRLDHIVRVSAGHLLLFAPMAGLSACRQTPEVGAVCISVQARVWGDVVIISLPRQFRYIDSCFAT